jgi:hypothetical protein
MIKTKFTWKQWQLTGATENLYDLDKEALEFFKLLVEEFYV